MTKWKDFFVESDLSTSSYGPSSLSWKKGREFLVADAKQIIENLPDKTGLDEKSVEKVFEILKELTND